MEDLLAPPIGTFKGDVLRSWKRSIGLATLLDGLCSESVFSNNGPPA